jgi:ERCC4-type nuclease
MADKYGVPTKQEFMHHLGDYKAGNMHVECKSIGDLIQSKQSGHFDRQMKTMDMNCERIILVIWGDIAKYVSICKQQGRNVTYSKIQGLVTGIIASAMANYDCSAYKSKDASEAAMFVVKLHMKSNKPAPTGKTQSITRVSTNDVRADMLLAIPGFGQDLVVKLLTNCGNIEEMLHPESLKRVRGMGTILRQRLLDVLTSEKPVKVEKQFKHR